MLYKIFKTLGVSVFNIHRVVHTDKNSFSMDMAICSENPEKIPAAMLKPIVAHRKNTIPYEDWRVCFEMGRGSKILSITIGSPNDPLWTIYPEDRGVTVEMQTDRVFISDE